MARSDSSFKLQDAIDRHQRGDLAEACSRYAEILRGDPRNVDALYLSGLAQCQLGDYPEAIKRLRKSVSLAPSHAAAHNTLSMAFRESGQLGEALASCDRAIASDQSFAQAHAHRGDLLADLRRPQEALAAYDRAVALTPELVPAWINRGSVLQELERHQEAVASYDRATALDPTMAAAWLNRSKALHALKRWDEALSSCDRAIALMPEFGPAYLARGILLKDRREFDGAMGCIDRAIALNPTWLEPQLERASVLALMGKRDMALQTCAQLVALNPGWFAGWQLHSRLLYEAGDLAGALAGVERALALKPELAEAHAFHGAILIKQNRPADAVRALDRAIARGPERGTFHVDRGLALNALGRYQEASASLEAGSRVEPDDAHIQFVVGLVDLLHGRWLQGFDRFERRFDVPALNQLHRRFLQSGRDIEQRFAITPQPEATPPFPRWAGEPPTGDVILLLETEQGIGDAIQFAGFAAHLARLGHRVQILTLPVMAPLLRTVPGVEAVLADATALDLEPNRWLPLMSVPHVLKVTPDSVPFAIPFLTAEPQRIEQWRQRLGGDGLKIGIAWQGNPDNWLDAGRSVPLAAFAPIADIPGVRLISLQKNPGAEQIDQVAFGDRIGRLMDGSDKSADALLDTAALIANLDLVVTSDSMIAHLAGALGRPAFIALRRVPDWRWLLEREDSPWYPTVRLFRQESEGDWPSVFAQISNAIRQMPAAAG